MNEQFFEEGLFDRIRELQPEREIDTFEIGIDVTLEVYSSENFKKGQCQSTSLPIGVTFAKSVQPNMSHNTGLIDFDLYNQFSFLKQTFSNFNVPTSLAKRGTSGGSIGVVRVVSSHERPIISGVPSKTFDDSTYFSGGSRQNNPYTTQFDFSGLFTNFTFKVVSESTIGGVKKYSLGSGCNDFSFYKAKKITTNSVKNRPTLTTFNIDITDFPKIKDIPADYDANLNPIIFKDSYPVYFADMHWDAFGWLDTISQRFGAQKWAFEVVYSSNPNDSPGWTGETTYIL